MSCLECVVPTIATDSRATVAAPNANLVAQGAPSRQQQGSGCRASPSRKGAPFFGHCFTCNGVAHRSLECSREPQSFRFRGYGHISRNCTVEPVATRSPSPKATSYCQSSFKEGTTLRECPRSSSAFESWFGNLHLGSHKE